jgi:predicted nucleic acid-binding protein
LKIQPTTRQPSRKPPEYAALKLSMADCALVVLAARYDSDRILSFDERHFRSVSTLGGDPFVVLPADVEDDRSR